jgi:CHAT domain-containing protein
MYKRTLSNGRNTRPTILFVALSVVSCSQRQPVGTYEEALASYRRGELSQSALAAHRGVERYRNGGQPALFWKFRLLESEALAALARDVDAKALLTEPVQPGEELKQLEVRRLIDLEGLSSRQESNTLLRQARECATDPELIIRINLASGTRALNAGDFQPADEAFHSALELANRQSYPYWQSFALKNLCYSSRKHNHYEEAIEFGLRALATAETMGYARIAAQARGNLVSAYRYLGDFESALLHGKQAVGFFKQINARKDLMDNLGELGLVYDNMDEPRRAVEYLKQASDLANELKNTKEAARHTENLATVLIEAKQWDAAAQSNRRAFALLADVEANPEIPYLKRNQARIEYGRGNVQQAIGLCEEILGSHATDAVIRWSVHDLLGEILADQKRYREANQHFESALTVIEESRSEISGANYRITLLSRLIPFFRERVDFLASQKDDAAALRAVESSRARVLVERLGRAPKPQQFPDLQGLQKFAKSSNSLLLSFWSAPKRSFAWLITANNTQRFELPGSAEIEKLVTGYRDIVEHSLQDPITTNDAAGPALWSVLMAQIAPQIPKNSRVIVIPDGPLHRLNLETLVVPSPQPHYWVEDVELAVAPSITMAMLKVAPEQRRSESLLLIGAPDYAGTTYEPLKGADREIRDIQARFPGAKSELRVGPKATPAAYRDANPDQFRLIHFAAHAEANRDQPLESVVVLSHQADSYKLYARDVIEIPIHADLVTLSACHSAGTRTYAGEGLMGFAWAFLEAGAHAVVAGLWDASDDSTEPLMDRFYAGIAAGQDPVSAMHTAKLTLLKGEAKFHKPFFWAPFQVYLGSASK